MNEQKEENDKGIEMSITIGKVIVTPQKVRVVLLMIMMKNGRGSSDRSERKLMLNRQSKFR